MAVVAVSLFGLAFLLGRASGTGSPFKQPSERELRGGAAASPVSDPRALDQQAQSLPLPTPAACRERAFSGPFFIPVARWGRFRLNVAPGTPSSSASSRRNAASCRSAALRPPRLAWAWTGRPERGIDCLVSFIRPRR